jgi:hypothetical protein
VVNGLDESLRSYYEKNLLLDEEVESDEKLKSSSAFRGLMYLVDDFANVSTVWRMRGFLYSVSPKISKSCIGGIKICKSNYAR